MIRLATLILTGLAVSSAAASAQTANSAAKGDFGAPPPAYVESAPAVGVAAPFLVLGVAY